MELSDIGKQMLVEWGESLTRWEKFVLSVAWLIPRVLLSEKSKGKILSILVEPAIKRYEAER